MFLNGLLFVGILCLIDYLIEGRLQSIYSYLFQGLFYGIFMTFLADKLIKRFTSKFAKNHKTEITRKGKNLK